MEHQQPSSRPDGASFSSIPLGDGNAAITADYLESLMTFAPFSTVPVFPPGSHHALSPGLAAHASADLIPAPPTCASQARGAANGLAARGIGGHPNHFSAPRAASAARPAPPSSLSGIAALYARAPARSRPTSVPAQPSGVRHAAHPAWAPEPAAQCHPVNPTASSPANYAGPFHHCGQGLVGFDFADLNLSTQWEGPVSSLSAALGPWVPSAVPAPDPIAPSYNPNAEPPAALATTAATFNRFDGGCGGFPNVCDQSWPASPLSLTPGTYVKEDPASAGCGRRNSTESTGVTSSNGSNVSTKSPEPAEGSHRQPSLTPSLSIVQCKPAAGRKRPAMEEIAPQGVASQMLRQVEVHDEQGNVKGTMYTFGNRVKTRAVFSEEKRQRTALARREGVCGRCKRSKRMCDLAQKQSLYVSCSLCAGTRLYKNAPRLPCFKATLQDILFFRSAPAPNEPLFTKRSTVYQLKDMTEPNAPVRTLILTQKIGHHQLTVYASAFTPMPEDVVSYKWRDRSGELHELKMPHFCLTNIEKIHSHFCQYIAQAKWSYLESLEKDDELAWMTVSTAIAYAKKRPNSLVADSLSLWAISRMIEIPWEICGPDTLGMSPVDDPGSPHHGKIPIPPIMDTQLDQVVIQYILKPLRARVVEKFEQMITPARPDTWWEVYLSSFILLNHIEHLAKHSVSHARTHTMATKYSNTKFLEAVFHTAKSILARFHFVCNGSVPLRLDWTSPKVAAMAKLDREQVEFMRKTQALVATKEQQVLRLRARHQYEGTLYWCGQLFTEAFDTSPVHVVEEIFDEREGPEPPAAV